MERDNDPRYTSKATSDWLKKKPLCGLKSERKPVVCAQKNLPRVKKSRPKSKSFFVYLIQSVNYSTVYLV